MNRCLIAVKTMDKKGEAVVINNVAQMNDLLRNYDVANEAINLQMK